MGRVLLIALIALAVLLTAGVILSGILQSRAAAEFLRCQNNLRELSFGLMHANPPGAQPEKEANSFFPAATVVNPGLPPAQRLSWFVPAVPRIDELGAHSRSPQSQAVAEMLRQLDLSKPWDAAANQPAARTRLTVALCPSQSAMPGINQAWPTYYLGNGGIGADTASLSLEQAGKRAGVFRYDTPTPLQVIIDGDGLSNSIALVESARDLGPWLRGGPSTVRSLDPDEAPYLGPGRFYAGCHPGRGNFAMADGSVRVINDAINPAVFRALLTINGGEQEVDFDAGR